MLASLRTRTAEISRHSAFSPSSPLWEAAGIEVGMLAGSVAIGLAIRPMALIRSRAAARSIGT